MTKITARRPRGIGQPKRPLSGFFRFSAEKRAGVVKRHPNAPMTEIAKRLGAQWKALSEAKRARYKGPEPKAQAAYEAAMAEYEYVPPPPKKAKKDPNAPKRSKSAYILYCQSARPKLAEAHPEKSVPELGSMLGAQWQALSEKARAPYRAAALKDKARYEAEKAAYTQS